MTEENDLKIPILDHIVNTGYASNGDICICTTGRSKCAGRPSIWTGLASRVATYKKISNDDAFELLKARGTGLYKNLDELKDADVLIKKKRDLCIKEDKINDVRKSIEDNNISLVFQPPGELPEEKEEERIEEVIETPTGAVTVPFVRPTVPQVRSSRWNISFTEGFWDGAKEVWEKTVDTDREHQLAICLKGDKITRGTSFIGNPTNVEVTDRDLSCPDDTVKIGSLHTHPFNPEELEKAGFTQTTIEKTMTHSLPDLDVMIKFNEPIACTVSKRSTTCMVNHSDYLPRILFRDLIVGGGMQYTADKIKMTGEMIKRGILKHRKVNNALNVSSRKFVECKPAEEKLSCKIAKRHLFLPRELTEEEIISDFPGVHTIGVENAPIIDQETGDVILNISPYDTDEVSCYIGEDGHVWCDGHESMTSINISKKILQPLYEKRIWEILNKEIRDDLEGSPLFALLTNYLAVLKTSSDEDDQKKGSLILGSINSYNEEKDVNKLVSEILSLISIM